MSLLIQLNICRSCLAEEAKTQLTEFPVDSDFIKSFQNLINSEVSLTDFIFMLEHLLQKFYYLLSQIRLNKLNFPQHSVKNALQRSKLHLNSRN